MKKLFLSLLCAFFALSSAKAALPPGGTTVYLVINQNWKTVVDAGGYIRFHLYTPTDDRYNMTLVAGTTDTYSVQMPATYTQTNLEFELMNASNSRLQNVYNVTGWQAGENCYTLNSGTTSGNAPTSGTYGVYTPVIVPAVTLNVSATVVAPGGSVTLSHSVLNFSCTPSVNYFVKEPGSTTFEPITSPYSGFTVCGGAYQFKAEASCGADFADNVKTVTVSPSISDIGIIYFKPNAAWLASNAVFQLHFYSCVGTEPRIMMTLVPGTGAGTNEDAVYEANVSGVTCTNFEINRFQPGQSSSYYNNNGNRWNGIWEAGPSVSNWCGKNIFIQGSNGSDGSFTDRGTWGFYTPPVPNTDPTVVLNVSATSSTVGGSITLSNTTDNFTCTPNVDYLVKVPGSSTFVSAASPYTFNVCGSFEFKAVASCNTEDAESSVKTVTVTKTFAAGDVIYFKPESWAANDGALFRGEFGTEYIPFVAVEGVAGAAGTIYSLTFTSAAAAAQSSFTIRRMNPGNPADMSWCTFTGLASLDWCNYNYFILTNPDCNNAAVGTMSNYNPAAKSVTLTINSAALVNTPITFSAVPLNFDNPVFTYYVKLGTGGTYQSTTSPYTPTATGDYYFKVEAAENSNPSTVIATDEKMVKVVLEPITVKAKIPANWAGPNYGLYVWGCNVTAQDDWRNATIQMYDCENWITYTFPIEVTQANVIFVNCGNTPNDWNGGGNNQTDEPQITSSTCFVIGSSTTGKRTLTATACPTQVGCGSSVPAVTLNVSATSAALGGSVTLSNTVENFTCTPNVQYLVKKPSSATFETAATPYTFNECGSFEFKAVASCNTEDAESSVKTVTVTKAFAAGDVIYFKPRGWWNNANAKFRAVFSNPGNEVIECVLVEGTAGTGSTDCVYSITITAAAVGQSKFDIQRYDPVSSSTWNTIDNLQAENWCLNNCYEKVDNNPGTMSYYNPAAKSVTLTINSAALVNTPITFSAVPLNFDNPVFTYYVKLGAGGTYQSTTSPYTPTATGDYYFKVEAAENSNPSTVIATDEKMVKVVSEPITVKAKIPANWAGPNYGLYVWGCNVTTENDWRNATVKMYDCEKWIEYTFPVEVTQANVIFVNCGNTPNDWNGGGNNQTDEPQITSSTCFVIGSSTTGKRTLTATACPTNEGCVEKYVTLTVSNTVVQVNTPITFSAEAFNFDNPVLTYYVKFETSGTYMSVTSPYTPAVAGDYYFKVEAAESSNTSNILATDEKMVTVVAGAITVKAKIPADWTGPNYGLYVWGCNVTTEDNWRNATVKTYDCEKWITYTFPVEVTTANVIFVNCGNGNTWNGDNNQTADISPITSSTCFVIGDNTTGKRTLTATVCPTEEGCVEGIYSPFADKINVYTQNGQINITSTEIINGVYIYNVQGQVIYANQSVNSNSLNVSKLPQGIYILKVATKNDNYSAKIVNF